MLNSSLKSELTNILALDDKGVHHQFPGRRKASFVRLRLPELKVERPIHLLDSACSLDETGSHVFNLT
jgi:hypothetical protein